MRELQQALGADSRPRGQPVAVDAERSAMQELVGVVDPPRAKPADIVVSDASEVLKRPIHNEIVSTHVEATGIPYNRPNPATIGVNTA